MPKQHSYVLGLNTYDHDVSACLLRDGAIAFAIAKERITREKHATGFYKEVIDYCLDAEGITLDDVDLIVRNCYILSILCICRVPTRWCRYPTIWRTPTAPLPYRRLRKAL